MRRSPLAVLSAPLVAVLLGLLAVVTTTAPAAAADPAWPTSPLGEPTGANDWSCAPTAARPTPVVIVHGTFGDRKSLLDDLSARLVDDGFCVYSLDYGNRGTGDVAASAQQLKDFVDRVLAATGAAKVSMVGHSQGGMMPRYYIKFLGGAAYVDDLVGLSPSNHGTTTAGDPNNPLTADCPACQQQAAGSDFLARLNADDETPGDVSYTQVVTRNDEVVVPYTSGYLAEGPLTTNLTVQDLCPTDQPDHLTIPMSRTAIAVALDALTHAGPADPSIRPGCAPALP